VIKKITITCPECGDAWQVENWITWRKNFTSFCETCAKKKTGHLVGINGEARRGEKHPRWTGGRYKNHSGYIVYTLRPEDDFFIPMASPVRRVMEHRLIMGRYLGRCLFDWEVVHHKNGIKDDNRIENLQLLPEGRWHLVDTKTKSIIIQLKNENKLLKERIKELESGK
jgi:hypothetical protein